MAAALARAEQLQLKCDALSGLQPFRNGLIRILQVRPLRGKSGQKPARK